MPSRHASPPDLDRLYQLLPTVVRMNDSAQGEPLRALLQVITEQVALLEDDLQRQYDNWFIETCEPWVVPYLADLIGHHAASGVATPPPSGSVDAGWPLPRREVAHTLRARRRKGTLALLEDLARDVAGWPAQAVEYGARLAQTQSLRLPHPERGRSASLRAAASLDALGGSADKLARSADLRRIHSRHAPGRHAPASVGVFVWRLEARPVSRAPAACLEALGPHCYSFSALGNDTALFNRPRQTDGSACRGDSALAFPQAITRRQFTAPGRPGQLLASASPDFYGLATDAEGQTVAQSLAIWAPGWPDERADDRRPIPAERIIPADLDDWLYQPPRDHVAVDPVRGRIAFPPRQLPRRQVLVSYHHGAVARLGGGEYTRPLHQPSGVTPVRVTGVDALRDALRPWQPQINDDGSLAAADGQPEHAVIEITDSGVYVLPLRIHLAAGHSLQLRAAQRSRPVLRLLDWQTDRPDNLLVEGEAGSRFALDGVMLAGRGLQVRGALASLTLRHATLVPGWTLAHDCCPKRPAEPSVELIDSSACVVVEHSIVGSLQINNNEVATEPVPLHISDSVVDATSSDGEGPQGEAIGAAGSRLAFATLHLVRSTVIGRVMTHAIELAEDSLLLGCVQVARRQTGCVRFCYVAPGSRTPRRYHCQPDGAEAALRAAADGTGAPPTEAALQEERRRVRPRFDSTRYGSPAYCRLAEDCAPEIANGSEDESEMGVHHALHQPQRLAGLQQRLDEYSPAGADTGILFAN